MQQHSCRFIWHETTFNSLKCPSKCLKCHWNIYTFFVRRYMFRPHRAILRAIFLRTCFTQISTSKELSMASAKDKGTGLYGCCSTFLVTRFICITDAFNKPECQVLLTPNPVAMLRPRKYITTYVSCLGDILTTILCRMSRRGVPQWSHDASKAFSRTQDSYRSFHNEKPQLYFFEQLL